MKNRLEVRHRVLAIISLSWVVSALDRMAMSFTIPSIALEFHLKPLAMGIVMSAFYAGYSISQIPGGLLADRFGCRRISTIAMLWWSAFTAITGAVSGVGYMIVARFLFGLGEGVYPAASFKAVAVWFPKGERTIANAIKTAAQPLGSALSPLIVGALLVVAGWRSVFFVLFVPGIITAFLFWRFVPNETGAEEGSTTAAKPGLEEVADEPVRGSAMLASLKVRGLGLYCAIMFFFCLADYGLALWLPSYLVQAHGLTNAQMGLAASLPRFAGVIGALFGGWISERFFRMRRMTPILLSQLIPAVLLFLTLRTSSVMLVVIYQTLAGFFFMSFFSAFWAIPITTVSKNLMGAVSGYITMAGQVAALLAPLLVGYLVEVGHGRYELAFGVLVGVLLVSSLLTLRLGTVPRSVKEELQPEAHAL